MNRLTCFLICVFVSETQGFEIPTNGLPEFAEYEDLVELAPGKFQFVPENRRYQRSVSGESGETMEEADQVTLYSYKVQSTITSRMANTVIQTKVVNNSPEPQNVVFDVQIPKGAFISNFSMTVDGTTFTSSIKEKTVGRALYSQARAKGKTAGLVRSRALDMENFKTEVNILPGAKVQFELHYQEVKWRKLGSYEHRLHLQPGRLAKHLEVDVWVIEPQGIKFLHVPDTFDGHFDGVPVISKGQQKAHVSFKPSVVQQRKCSNCSETAVDGELVVMYDVNREEKAGELEVFNGYFVHFFAPENLDPIPKNILFVIDVSGSMWGIKMKQTVEAMKTILDDLRDEDQFSVVDFNHNVRTWRNDLVSATKTQIADAKKYIEKIQPSGGTNINEALLRAIFILNEANNLGMLDPESVSLIILVSDGDPTVGNWVEKIGLSSKYSMAKLKFIDKDRMFRNKVLFNVTFLSMILFDFIFSVYFPVENDPHFIIYLPKNEKNICFNIDSEPGKIFNLVSDPESGILVNGQLIGAKKPKNGKLSTYFGTLGFYLQSEDMKIEISTKTITLSRGSRVSVLSWSDTAHVINQRVLVSVKKEQTVTITLDKDMSFSVLLHRVWKKHPINVDFLGIYIPPTNKFSPKAHGLIGQFMHEPKIRIFNERPGKVPKKPEASMEVKGYTLTVTRGLQKDYRTDRVFGTEVSCWFVHNSGKGFIDGHYKDYFVPQLYSFLKRP
nr:inter-alpha-trypsin inhibitor heavy chain H2 [Mirounga angustirostris]